MRAHDGRLGLDLFDDRFVQNPYPLYERMLACGAVHQIGDSRFYAVCSWDAVNDVIARPHVFSSNLTATMTFQDGNVGEFVMGEVGGDIQALATADDPAHAIHRKMLVPQLTAKRINAMEPFIAETADRLWDDGIRNGTIEWMSTIANRLPMMIVTRLIGVPEVDSERLMRWGYSSTQVVEGLVGQDQLAAAGVSVMELGAYLNEQFRRAAAEPGENLLSVVATACETGRLADLTALNMMITLFSAGGESTASLLGSAAHILACRADLQQQLREDPDRLGPFLEEVLRYEPPFRGHYRHVLDDTTLAGVELSAGSRLLMLWGAANRDPAHFDAPNDFRMDRADGKGHISFGKGAHFCVGAALARLEARIVLGRLLERTARFAATKTGRWLPSLLVRRLEHLELDVE
jgi:cytochrome P450 family 144